MRSSEANHATEKFMDSYKLAVKFFVEDASRLKTDEDFVPVFHRWIQTRAVPEHQLIDVADYAHVKDGPGTVLISHEANIHADLGDGRLGLLYVRKQPLAGSLFRERLRQTFQYALQACDRLETEESLRGRLRFRTDEAVFRIHDRLHAPNTQQTFDAIQSDLNRFLADLYQADVRLTFQPHPEKLFEVGIYAPGAVPIGKLLDAVATR